MPDIKRTLPNGHRPPIKATLPRQGASLLSQAIDIGDLPDSPIHMLLWGRNGIGKTTFACKFPKPLLLIACEYAKTGGAQSVKKIPGVKYLRVKTVEEVKQIGIELKNNCTFETVVFDSGTSLDEIVLADICGWSEPAKMLRFGKVTQDQYTERSERMRVLLDPIISLDCHVVVIANEKDHNAQESRKSALTKANDVTSESFFSAAMGGGTARWCKDACDWVCQLYVAKEVVTTKKTVGEGKNAQIKTVEKETGKVVRRLRLTYHPNFDSRIRSPNGELVDGVPDYIESPTWEDIEDIHKGT